MQIFGETILIFGSLSKRVNDDSYEPRLWQNIIYYYVVARAKQYKYRGLRTWFIILIFFLTFRLRFRWHVLHESSERVDGFIKRCDLSLDILCMLWFIWFVGVEWVIHREFCRMFVWNWRWFVLKWSDSAVCAESFENRSIYLYCVFDMDFWINFMIFTSHQIYIILFRCKCNKSFKIFYDSWKIKLCIQKI